MDEGSLCTQFETEGVQTGLMTSDFSVSVTAPRNKTNVSIVNPVVHLLGEDAAAIAYIKVTQSIDK